MTQPAAHITLRPGDIVNNRYRVEEWLGGGGFAQVYRATQMDLDRPVALKVLDHASMPADNLNKVIKRFEREAKTISMLKSPYTVSVYEFGRHTDGSFFMALELIKGKELREVQEQQGAFSPERTFNILRQALESLSEAHMMGVLHRDIKPSNIMLYDHAGKQDQVKVLDFGIASIMPGHHDPVTMDMTAQNTLIGTPRYMAPEHIRGERVSPAADIYSMGLVAVEMLKGEKLIPHASFIQVLSWQMTPDPIDIPSEAPLNPDFRAILERMVAKDMAQRYHNVQDILADLNAISSPRGTPLPPGQQRSPSNSFNAIPIPPSAASGSFDALTSQEMGTYGQNDTNKKIAIVVAGALLVVGLIGALFALSGNKPTTTKTEQTKIAKKPITSKMLIETTPVGAEILANDLPMGSAPVSLDTEQFEFPLRLVAKFKNGQETKYIVNKPTTKVALEAPALPEKEDTPIADSTKKSDDAPKTTRKKRKRPKKTGRTKPPKTVIKTPKVKEEPKKDTPKKKPKKIFMVDG